MPDTGKKKAAETDVPQLSETESSFIYDEMLRTGRIIQVTSGGVRVFDESGLFIREEVLKARVVFPRVDNTPGLQRMLGRLLEKDEYRVEKVRNELYRSLYKPIKRSLDGLVHDSRIFFADSSTLDQVRSDLDKVIQRMDLLTLGMLNDLLKQSELEFRRHIEAGVYSGLAGSVVFGDYKRKLTDKKVVEDLMMMGIVHGLGPELEKSKSFQELCRTSKSFYDVEKVLKEVRAHPEEPTNVLSEILATSIKYIEALDQDEDRDPLNALAALMATIGEHHVIALGALAQKYAISEYVINYLVRDGAFRTKLCESETRFETVLRARMKHEGTPATSKLGEMFLRQLRYKATVRLGSDVMHHLDEFVGALLPVKLAASVLLDELAGNEHADCVQVRRLTESVLATIEACLELHRQHTDPASWPELENVPGGAYLIAYRKRPEIEYQIQRVVRVIERGRERAGQLLESAQETVLRESLDELEKQVAAVSRFRTPTTPQPFDVVRVLESASQPFRQDAAFQFAVSFPDEPVMVLTDALGLEQAVQELLGAIAETIRAGAGESDKAAGAGRSQHSVSLVATRTEHFCLVEIHGSSGRLPNDVQGVQKRLEEASPGAGFRVSVEEGRGATFLLEFPLAQPVTADEP
jgi:hypothetical protein